MTLVHVYTGSNPMDALLFGGLLQAEGLDVHLPGGDPRAVAREAPTDGVPAGAEPGARVFVPREQRARALELVEVYRREVRAVQRPLPRPPAPAPEAAPEPEPRPVLVHRARDAASATLLAGLLQSEGLPAWAPCERDAHLAPVVFVLEPHEARAREVLDAWLEAMGRRAGAGS